MATCNYCQYQDDRDFQFCPRCGQSNNTVQAVEKIEVIPEKEIPNNEFKYPWEENGEEVIVDNLIPSDAIGQPFEIYFYKPGTGYGYLIFKENEIALKFPKGKAGGYGGGHFDLDFDADGDFDADDLGCLAAVLMALGIGYVVKKLASSDAKRKIRWSTHIKNVEIKFISLEGRTIELSHTGKKPNIKLRVAASDGERLYRELYLHFPSSVSRWTFELRNIIDNQRFRFPETDGF